MLAASLTRRAARAALIALALPIAASAQESPITPPPRPNKIGLVAGANFSTLDGVATDLSHRTGFIGGAYASFGVTPTFSVQPELLYIMKGATSPGVGSSATLKFDYFELPVLARVDVPTHGLVTPHFYAGPAIALRARCGGSANTTGGSITASCSDLAAGGADLRKFDVGLVGGGGLGLNLGGSRTLTVGARYDLGLLHVASDANVRNRALSFLAGFEFPFDGHLPGQRPSR